MKKRFWRIMVAAVFFTVAKVNNLNIEWLNTVLYLISYTIAGGDIIVQAFKNIARGKVFDENFLMTIATVGAILISEYAEGIAVMLFFQVGELFQDYGVNKSRKSIANLMNIRPEFATVKRGEELITMDPDEVKVGDIIVIKAGERVPLDAIVIEGNSMVDTCPNCESIPRQ